MIDLYLRAGNAGALASACPWLRGESDGGERFWITSGDGFVFDPIGTLVLEPGTATADGNGELEPPVVADGWHGNLRCTEDVAARVPATVIVHPAEPKRVWA